MARVVVLGQKLNAILLYLFISWRKGRHVGGKSGGHGSIWAVGVVGAVWVVWGVWVAGRERRCGERGWWAVREAVGAVRAGGAGGRG